MPSRVHLFVGGLVLATMLASSCATPSPYVRPPTGDDTSVDPARVHAVLINGGGRRASNYQSHVIHLREVLDLLRAAGVPDDQIAVFASDGEDPGVDLATRELRPEGDGWLLDGTSLENSIGRPMEYVSTQIDGVALRPATQEALGDWFSAEGADLEEGDVLFVYVTDHGTRGSEDAGARGNAISLWGFKESLTVDELAGMLESVPEGIRVVTLMSQCYSGGFAQLAYGLDDALPSGRVCGYFSTSADREAYGCHPENRGVDNIGHSIRFLEGLRGLGSFPKAHVFTVVNDHTPDVPLRTSDEFLRETLERAAWEEGRDPIEYGDALLAEAWGDPGRYERQIRLLDRIGRGFGFASPRSLKEVEERLGRLPKVAEPLAKYSEAWRGAQSDLARANLERFLRAHPEWPPRLKRSEISVLPADSARALGSELVAELGPATRDDPETFERLEKLQNRSSVAEKASYRMDVREAALQRMQTLLIEVAADVYLRTRGTAQERQARADLLACEDFALRLPEYARLEDREAFPAYADDLEVAREVLPAWMGIQFRQAPPETRAEHGLSEGAVSVQRVFPSSPALAAGIEPGDVILGPPGRHFTEPRQIREWTMLSRIDEPYRLDILRGSERIQRTLRPGAHPGRFPELPAPPGEGDAAPPLRVSSYRADAPESLEGTGDTLLFFWATWCAPCKQALPELVAYAEATGTRVVAITDEGAEPLDRFFAQFEGAFPEIVVMDRNRETFLSYGVSGTPTFVLIGRDGIVKSMSSGYSRKKGLGLDGWKWEG